MSGTAFAFARFRKLRDAEDGFLPPFPEGAPKKRLAHTETVPAEPAEPEGAPLRGAPCGPGGGLGRRAAHLASAPEPRTQAGRPSSHPIPARDHGGDLVRGATFWPSRRKGSPLASLP